MYLSRSSLNWNIEVVLLFLYKLIFEFVFLSRYMTCYGYLYNTYRYEFDFSKWIISVLLFLLFALLLRFMRVSDQYKEVFIYFIRFVYVISLIPMLSVYAVFYGIDFINIIYPSLFMLIMILTINRYTSKASEDKQLIRMPKILNVNIILFSICFLLAIALWIISGRPVFFSFSDALERRLQLRAAAMPQVLNYLFIFLGSTVFPYLFAKNIDEKKYIYSFLSLVCGVLLFFINGMKTWLFLYFFFIGIAAIIKAGKGKPFKTCVSIEVMALLVIVTVVCMNDFFNSSGFISQVARVTTVPNDIGFTFVAFFKKPENPFLYLRESILRVFFESPYPYGSDFFVTNGMNVTISSARSNNGLWGDAFKNFGLLGIVIYPIVIAKVFSVIESNSRHMKPTLRLFVLFMAYWGSINTSFFTWLLTGGVIVLILLEKIDRTNLDYNYLREMEKMNELFRDSNKDLFNSSIDSYL